MAERFTKNKVRTETPGYEGPSSGETARDPSEGRSSGGRFAAGNRAAVGQGIKALIRKGLGDPSNAATAEMVREATRLYLAILRSLPSDGPGVRVLVAGQARHTVLATHYANEAARIGLATPQGLKLAEAARAHDTTAQRLAVTAYDRAARERSAQPRDAMAELRKRMGLARRER
jgi:hypothetical protein